MYNYITSFSQIGNFFKDLEQTKVIGLDTETTSLDYITAVPILLQININDAIYILDLRKLDKKYIIYVLDLLVSSNKIVIGHNIKYDIQILYNNYNILITNVHDTMLSEVLIHQGIGNLFISLVEVIKRYTEKEISKEERKEFYDNPDVIITENILIYSALDVKYLPEIREKQLTQLGESKQLAILDLESKLIPVTAMMEYNGVLTDADKWNKINTLVDITKEDAEKDLLEDIIAHITNVPNALECSKLLAIEPKALFRKKLYEEITDKKEIEQLVRENLNVGSSKQVFFALTNFYGLDIPDTNEHTLLSVQNRPEIINKVLHFREYNKKKSSYGENLLDKIHPVTGRIHAKFNQLGTYSGRYSSDSPNLQNIPRPIYRPDGTPINYRECFIAGEGKKKITCDYAQQEYRLIGEVTGEKKIIDAYKAGKDLHTLTASIVNKVSLDEVTKSQRTDAKPVNFGVFYGATEYGLSYNLGINLEDARRIYHSLVDGIPTFMKFRSMIQEKILEKGYSVTLLGRRRYFKTKTLFEDSKERYKYVNSIKREGFNHIIQGSGADITKLAMINIFYNNPFSKVLNERIKILMAEHDEIVVLVDEGIAEPAFEFVKQSMIEAEQPFLGEIPAEVSGIISDCWEKS